MKLRFAIPLVAILLFVGCRDTSIKQKVESSEHAETAQVSTATVVSTQVSAPSCPAQALAEFVQQFANSIEMQKKYSSNPLVMSHIDAAAVPEPKTIQTSLAADQVKWPVMPDTKTQQADGLQVEISEMTNLQTVVKLAQPDTGYQIKYTFQKTDCWTLIRVDDQSM